MLGETVSQFRKWMWSTWVRYMGARVNLHVFNRKYNEPFEEALNRYRKGAFTSLLHYVTKPLYSKYIDNRRNQVKNPKAMAFIKMFEGIGNMFEYYAYHYHIMSESEKANVKRAAMFFGNFTVISTILLALGLMKDDDENKDLYPAFIDKELSRLTWIFAGLQTEYADALPLIGWANFYRRTKENVVPIERQLFTMGKLAKELIAYPFRDEQERIYQRGQYAGEDKVWIKTQQLIPIYRQYFKDIYMEQQVNYYNMYNPFMNIIN
jgi:hypothetical protein